MDTAPAAAAQATTVQPALPRFIFRLAFAKEWQGTLDSGLYTGGDLDATDGFIHLSTQSQCQTTAQLFFKGAEGLQSWTVDTTKLKASTSVYPGEAVAAAADAEGDRELRWEPAPTRPDDDLFPHVYGGGGVPVDAIVKRTDLPLGEDGVPTFPAEAFDTSALE